MSMWGPAGAGRRGPKQFGRVLARLWREKKFLHKGKYGPLVSAWNAIAGEEIVAQTAVASCKHGLLIVEVASPVLLQELAGFRSADLLEKLRATPGGEDVADIRFRLPGRARR